MKQRVYSSFEKVWLRIFAKTADKKGLKKHVLSPCNYIWHVFSWELLPKGSFLEGNEARKAFDKEDKTNARYYEPFPNNGPHNPTYDSPSAAELDALSECYVISSNNQWTYIKTHEDDLCGPYFYKLTEEQKEQ